MRGCVPRLLALLAAPSAPSVQLRVVPALVHLMYEDGALTQEMRSAAVVSKLVQLMKSSDPDLQVGGGGSGGGCGGETGWGWGGGLSAGATSDLLFKKEPWAMIRPSTLGVFLP
jgi:hypothetical protein